MWKPSTSNITTVPCSDLITKQEGILVQLNNLPTYLIAEKDNDIFISDIEGV